MEKNKDILGDYATQHLAAECEADEILRLGRFAVHPRPVVEAAIDEALRDQVQAIVDSNEDPANWPM